MDSAYADAVLPHRVSPFGYLRIEAYLQLPEAFRSLSRPSSAPDAKAFPLRPSLLDLIVVHAPYCSPHSSSLHARSLRSLGHVAGLVCRFAFSFALTTLFKQKSGPFYGSLSIRIMQTHLFYQQNCNYPNFRICSFSGANPQK